MSFKGENAYNFTEKISFPRLIGTEGWLKARKMIKDEFKSFGYEDKDIQTQDFKSSLYVTNVLLRVLMIPILVIGFLIVWSYFYFPLVSLIISIIILFLLPFISKFASSGGDYKEPKEGIESQNVYVKIKSNNSKSTIILMGHYDTKSQVLSIVQRVICYVLLFIGAITCCILGLIGSILKLWFITNNIISISILVAGIITGIASILLMANAVQNKSPGALDNGTAIATVLELSRIFKAKDKPPKNVDLIFLCTDAEEQGVLGASAFINKFEDKFDKKTTFFINFEAPGAKDVVLGLLTSFGMPKKQYTSKKLNLLALKSAKLLDIEIKEKYWPIGLLADHNPMINHGYEATLLMTMAMSAGIHTPNDTMENVSKEKLEEAGLVSEKMIELFDEELE